jgi:ubiquinone biosynthesis protein UbiJ
MTEHPRSDELYESSSNAAITLELPREEVEALLLAVDALQPLLDRLRAQIAPVPLEAPVTGSLPAPRVDDAVQRVTRLARESLQQARRTVGERRITPEQRTAWQEAARRYWLTARHAVMHERQRERPR